MPRKISTEPKKLRKTALLALVEGLNEGKVIASWGEGHNKKQKVGMVGAPIMIDGVKYLLCITTIRNRKHIIKPYAITLKDGNGNIVNEEMVVGNNLVHDSNNGNSTFGNDRLSTTTASHHTNTPLISDASLQQNIQTNKNNNKNINCNRIMKKNRIRLTESQLHQVIKESVKRVIKEGRHDATQLPSILEDMASYAQECLGNGEDLQGYFGEIINTGLYHDACGKSIDFKDGVNYFTTDY